VGAYAVQLASQSGATVIATASGDDEAYLKSIGTSRVIDYRETEFEKILGEKVDMVFHLTAGDTQKRSFLVLKEGGHLVSATQPVSQEETASHRVNGTMMRLAPSGEMLGKIARLLEDGTIRPDVATVYPLKDAAEAWKDIAANLPVVHGVSPSGPGAARRTSHGKIVLRVAPGEDEIRGRAYEVYLARGAQPGREMEDWLQAERELAAGERAERIESEPNDALQPVDSNHHQGAKT
jgi:Zinc-binding dehydrogenase/Protein of unknown function (DUF2934)